MDIKKCNENCLLYILKTIQTLVDCFNELAFEFYI